MKNETHQINETQIAEVISEVNVINRIEDGLNLLGTLYYQGFDKITLKAELQEKSSKSFPIIGFVWLLLETSPNMAAGA